MPTLYKALTSVFATCGLLLICLLSKAFAAESMSVDELVQRLQQGGYVVYMRHAMTDTQQRDQPELVLEDCSTQRNLAEAGRQQARVIAQAFARLHIAVGQVYSSPFCRCLETAKLAFGQFKQRNILYFAVGVNESMRHHQGLQLQQMLDTPPAAGQNTVIVSHTANLQEAVSIWPASEGVMHVFKPSGIGALEHLGAIPAQAWEAYVR